MNQGITTMLDKTQRVAIDAPALSGGINKPDLLTVAQAKDMSVADMTALFKDHLNPGQLHFMKLLGFNKIKIETAEGMYYVDQNGRKILDFFGGFGSLALGHNHQRLISARKAVPGRKPPRDRHRLHVAICGGSRQEPRCDCPWRP